jgi:hypothetical protein
MDKCPVCKANAEELQPGLFDGHALKCSVHGEIEFSDTVRATRSNYPREAWEQALTHARQRVLKTGRPETLAGHRPRILDDDF